LEISLEERMSSVVVFPVTPLLLVTWPQGNEQFSKSHSLAGAMAIQRDKSGGDGERKYVEKRRELVEERTSF
jgi:hypothetical protein